MWKPATSPNAPRPNNTETDKTNMANNLSNTSPTPSASSNELSSTPTSRYAANNPQEQASIGKSLIIKGEVSGSESLYIDGRVEGTISLPGNRLTVGPNGVVAANVNAREIVVIGKLRGNLVASDRVDIRNEGSLTGDVIAQRISIEDGAFFKGGIDIRKPGQKGAEPGSPASSNKIEPSAAPASNAKDAAAVRA